MRYTVFSRILMIAFAACVCTWLTSKAGTWASIGLWAVGMLALCGGIAFLMSRQKPGRITPINYIAGIVLSWGYKIGRGKLLPIVIESWFRWLLVGVAVVILNTHGAGWRLATVSQQTQGEYHRSAFVTILLLLSWLVVGSVALALITNIIRRANDNPLPPGTFPPILGMIGIVAASVALTIYGHSAFTTGLALLISGGPILVIGGGYGLMLLAMLVFGKHTPVR